MAEASEPHNTAKRDFLRDVEARIQAKWEAEKIFEANAPAEGCTDGGKFFGTFPYPYMNGLLHLGHAFSISKLVFACAYERMRGKNVLFPQGFHLTGMPIKACADKLRFEIDAYGFAPGLANELPEVEEPVAAAPAADASGEPAKFVAKKSKAVAKKGPGNTQWSIMRMSGIPEDDIPLFADAQHWLRFFPPLAVRDLDGMGCGIDWRRSFVTTDVNPYYDSFVRWQFLALRERGKVIKDKRYAIFSPKDGQPCADHDRASGEGALPQEYTLVKLRVLELRGSLEAFEGQGEVYLAAATLRPETMYGQTNVWARPSDPKRPDSDVGLYGIFKAADGDFYVMTDRAARNLAFQDFFPVQGEVCKVGQVRGEELMGLPIAAPRAPFERVFVLPLLTIRMDKGTGVVTSVPSDSPDDWAALQDLVNKPKLRALHNIPDEAVMPFAPVPIIDIPGLGDMAARAVCESMKITSQNDADKLAAAKAEVYRRGFDSGVMLVGPHAGKPVKEAKPLERAELLRQGLGLAYAEPEKEVRSRSDDDCVVALTDQWYIVYGEDEWRSSVSEAFERMRWLDAAPGADSASSATRGQFEHALSWLNQWACSRSFGLGTRLPWDPEFLIESLSDSTVYMAYYTVAHLFQQGDMYGARGAVPAECLTPRIWDYIFMGGPLPEDRDEAALPEELLRRARREFEYWYPFDVRVSGKDLIQNHLTFCLYTHAALWGPEKMPGALRCNGHLQLDNQKMSKSTGNFKTLEQALHEYGADAMRVGLANSGDTLEDANFEHDVANQAILRLFRQAEWAREALEALPTMRGGAEAVQALEAARAATCERKAVEILGASDADAGDAFWDRAFANEMDAATLVATQAFEQTNYREAVGHGWHNLATARDAYVLACDGGMRAPLALRFARLAAQLVAPVAPHLAEHVWGEVLRLPGSVLRAPWPVAPAADYALQQALRYVDGVKRPLKEGFEKAASGGKGKGARKGAKAEPVADGTAPPPVSEAVFYVVDRFGGWKARALGVLAAAFDPALPERFPGKPAEIVLEAVADCEDLAGVGAKALRPLVFPFVAYKTKQAREGGALVLAERLPFDEAQVLEDSVGYLVRTLLELKTLKTIRVRRIAFEDLASHPDPRVQAALPGEPAILFV